MNRHSLFLMNGNKYPNTFIGGVSGMVTSASVLASDLGISVGNISSFKIVGSNIQCHISVSYVIPAITSTSTKFYANNSNITYYRDTENKVYDIGLFAFYNCANLKSELIFLGITTLTGQYICRKSPLTFLNFKNATSIGNSVFYNDADTLYKVIYIPNCTSLGSSVSDNSVFYLISPNSVIYTNPYLATCNAGAPDGDLSYAIGRGATVRYVTNFTAPNAITDLSIIKLYNSVIQLNFTVPSSTNAIEYYKVLLNGIDSGYRVTASGQFVYGLESDTYYDVILVAVDVFYNISPFSNLVSITTLNRTAVDADAISYITASSNSKYQDIIDDCFVSLKSASIYTKIQAFWMNLGTSGTQQKWNGKNPLDTDAAYRLTYSGSGTFSKDGYQCNGSNAWADTHLVQNAVQNVNSNGITVVVGTNIPAIGVCVDIGAFANPNGSFLSTKRIAGGRKDAYFNNSTLSYETGVDDSRCILTGQRVSASVNKMYKNGSLVVTGSAGGSLVSNSFNIGRLNASNGQYSPQRIQFTAIHEGLTDSEVATFHTIIDTFESALGRKTW